ncbi:hypothetical protein V2J09_017026 [Rumex salicifolius]
MAVNIENYTSRATGSSAHVVILPIPILGRTNPMLQFAKRLSSKGVTVTLATTSDFAAQLLPASESSPFLSIESVTGDSDQSQSSPIDELIWKFEAAAAPGLARLIEEKSAVGIPVRCLVYDSSFPWALRFARKIGILAAPFFPQLCAVSLIFCHVHNGVLEAPITGDDDGRVSAPGLPELVVGDMPTLVREVGKNPVVEKMALIQFQNFHEADWQFFNTFDDLEFEVLHFLFRSKVDPVVEINGEDKYEIPNCDESQVINWMRKQWPNIKPIGPAIPSMHLDKRIKDDTKYGLSPFNLETSGCIQWLDAQKPSSTIYVSFGSLAALGGSQMEEMASALKSTKMPFLWVVKAKEVDNLPPGFREEALGQGMIVNWCPQLDVLGHRAVGCFFTHCGWNSTLEAVSSGVPLVSMPLWADQPTNAKFVEGVWGVGVRVKGGRQGVVKREEIERCIREVMEGEKGKEVRLNASKLKMAAREAMQEGGSSDRNIDEFVAKSSVRLNSRGSASSLFTEQL